MENKNVIAKPFFKWVGGKTQLITQIEKELPVYITKYYEPFVGGGAMLFHILQNVFTIEEAVINDYNPVIANAYIHVRDHVGKVIHQLKTIERKYNSYQEKNPDTADLRRSEYYYQARQRFNDYLLCGCVTLKDEIHRTALFLFLNKTCFNGLYRVNKRGEFNVPFNRAKSVSFDYDNLEACSHVLHNVTILCGDYKHALPLKTNSETLSEFYNKHAFTFVYMDPPYKPVKETLGEVAYTADGFDDNKQKELKQVCDKLCHDNIMFIQSNSDPEDKFFDTLYVNEENKENAKYKIKRVSARRNVNSKGTGRGEINEIIIKNF